MSWNSKEPRWHGDKKPRVNPIRFVINGQEFDRVLYGEGSDDLDHSRCDDCGVPRGQLHQIGCDLEPCRGAAVRRSVAIVSTRMISTKLMTDRIRRTTNRGSVREQA